MKTFLITVCAVTALAGAALAQHSDGAMRGAASAHAHFAAGPVAQFAPRDLATWRGGYWWHGWRGGRIGWWWFADGNWYWYATPAYPYPDHVADDYVPGADPTGPPLWYCDNPPGYYPFVRTCPTPWRPVAPQR